MDKTVIEVNGVKLEVDLRTARRVENYSVGDNVKVLVKNYGDSFKSHAGVIVGFDAFEKLPTIVIAYLDGGYEAQIKFCYFNKETKDVEICPMMTAELAINKELAVASLERQIQQKEAEVATLREKKSYFLDNFGRYFERASVGQSQMVAEASN